MATLERYIGLISGTSVDAIDCILGDFSGSRPTLLQSHSEPVPAAMRQQLLSHCSPDATSLPSLGGMDVELGELFACAATALLDEAGVAAESVRAIGSHGQTLYHSPDSRFPFTLQIADPNVIAARTGITTVADFRRMDMALGGQGAPLAPLFHQAAFHSEQRRRAILNLGGIANLTFLPPSPRSPVLGLDTGPASGLMDDWICRHRGDLYDEDGQWAQSGAVHHGLLQQLMADPYFSRPAPKSTGREYFSSRWLDRQLQKAEMSALEPQDIQATLLELSARSVVDAFRFGGDTPEQLVVCGGGAHNSALIQRINELASATEVIDSEHLGVAPDWVEAMAFAWLAKRRLQHQAVDCTRLTGSRQPALLGGVYEPPPHSRSDGE